MTNWRIAFAPVALITLIFAFTILPAGASAAITIHNPVLTPNKATYSSGDPVIITFGVNSDNSTVSFIMELMNKTPDLSNSTIQNYTFTLVGSPTNGNWMYVLNVSAGIYQIMRAFATDNSSYVQTADYTQSFLGFEALGASNTTNATTTTTTSTEMLTTTTTTSQNIQTQENQFDVGSPLGYIMTVFGSNPIFLVIIAITIIVPIIILLYVLKKRPKNELYEPNQNLQRIRWSQDGEDDNKGNRSENDSENEREDDKKHSGKE